MSIYDVFFLISVSEFGVVPQINGSLYSGRFPSVILINLSPYRQRVFVLVIDRACTSG